MNKILGTKAFAAVAAIALTACTQTAGPTSSGPVGAPNVQVPTNVAIQRFQEVCLKTRGNLAAAQTALINADYVQDRSTGIYYSQVYNMSFRLAVNGGSALCSMVAEPKDNVNGVLKRFSTLADNIVVRDAGKFEDDHYVNIVSVVRVSG